MSVIKEISWMSKSGYSDIELLEYIDEHFDEIECELNGEEYKELKHNRNPWSQGRLWFAPNVVYVSTIQCMYRHTIIRCNIQEENVYTRDLIILRLY